MIEGLFCFLIGLIGHEFEAPTDRRIPDPDLNRLAKYTEGGAMIFGLYTLAIWRKIPPEFRFVAVASLALVELCLGIGVVVGYLLNGVRKQ